MFLLFGIVECLIFFCFVFACRTFFLFVCVCGQFLILFMEVMFCVNIALHAVQVGLELVFGSVVCCVL